MVLTKELNNNNVKSTPIAVRLVRNPFDKSGKTYYGRIERNTVGISHLLAKIQKVDSGINLNVAKSVIEILSDVILDELALGNAINILDLGVIYLATKGTVRAEGQGESFIIPDMPDKVVLKFSPSDKALKMTEKVALTFSAVSSSDPAIVMVEDMTTLATDGVLSSGTFIRVTGQNLKIVGENAGIYFAPVNDDSSVSGKDDWVKVESSLNTNTPSVLVFKMPQLDKTKAYKLVVETYGCGGKRKISPKTCFSDTIMVE